MALRVQREGLDDGGLARSRRTVQQKPELVGVALDAVLAWECVWGEGEGSSKSMDGVRLCRGGGCLFFATKGKGRRWKLVVILVSCPRPRVGG